MKVEAAILTIQLQQPNLVARNLWISDVKKQVRMCLRWASKDNRALVPVTTLLYEAVLGPICLRPGIIPSSVSSTSSYWTKPFYQYFYRHLKKWKHI